MDWVPLHVHSEYSILNSTCSIYDIVDKAKQFNMSSIALTDSGNLYGAVDFYKTCKSFDIKPIIGCEILLCNTSRLEKKKSNKSFPIVLLVKDAVGYKNLCKLSSIGFLEGFYYYPRIDKEVLEKYSEGLICLSGGSGGLIPNLIIEENKELLQKEVQWFLKIFGEDYYFELQNHTIQENDLVIQKNFNNESWLAHKYDEYIKKQQTTRDKLIQLSKEYNIKCVATNASRYLNKEDWQAHEILLNIQSGEACEIWDKGHNAKMPNPKRRVYPNHEFYFKSQDQIKALFADCIDSVNNTNLLVEKCNFNFDFNTKHYPTYFHCKEKSNKMLYDLCINSINTRYENRQLNQIRKVYPDEEPIELVKKRLEYELNIIFSKGLGDYFLIVYDFINYAKKNNIVVGPGRGSVVGSVTSYLCGITEIEPIHLNLFFERFINPGRDDYPDIDIDICMEKRQIVIDYIIQKYGQAKVAQIITFGSMKARMAIKDVGRVLSIPLSKVNEIVKLVPEELDITLEKALVKDRDLQKLYKSDAEAKRLIDLARPLEGCIRNTSTHAAGLIISSDEIINHLPVCSAKDADIVVTQFAMKPVAAIGMLKIDLLGLKTLTCIEKAIEFIRINHQKKIDWVNLPLNEQKTFDLLNQGKTLGIFQLESSGMQDLIKKLKIEGLTEIIAVAALYRPGPMEMIPSFINRKYKKEKIEIEHPDMAVLLKDTYGIILYQEQVMQIANKLAGLSLQEGDVLRRAMGKKDVKQMKKEKIKFVNGCVKNNIKENIAIAIFDKMEKFAAYGFNKSHAAAYGYIAYVTAYLKANFSCEWMAALMTYAENDLSKISKFIQECYSLNIEILPPDINESSEEFVPTKKGIRFSLNAIKGVGSSIVKLIVKTKKQVHFFSLYDFMNRIEDKKIGKKTIELLIDAGCFDCFKWTRDELKAFLNKMYDYCSKKKKEKEKGVLNFFSLMNKDVDEQFLIPPNITTSTTKLDILNREKQLLGFYLTGNPLEKYFDFMKEIKCVGLKDLKNIKTNCFVFMAFIIDEIKVKISFKDQRKFAILKISDGIEKMEIPIWANLYEDKIEVLKETNLVMSIMEVMIFDQNKKFNCKYIEEIEVVKADLQKFMYKKKKFENNKKEFLKKSFKERSIIKKTSVNLFFNINKLQMSHILKLKQIIKENTGDKSVEINFFYNQTKLASIYVDNKYKMLYNESSVNELKKIPSFIKCEIK